MSIRCTVLEISSFEGNVNFRCRCPCRTFLPLFVPLSLSHVRSLAYLECGGQWQPLSQRFFTIVASSATYAFPGKKVGHGVSGNFGRHSLYLAPSTLYSNDRISRTDRDMGMKQNGVSRVRFLLSFEGLCMKFSRISCLQRVYDDPCICFSNISWM